MVHKTNRRHFLEQSAEAAAILAAASSLGGVHAFAGEKCPTVKLGLIGCGGIMQHHVSGLAQRGENVRIAWLCDVDPCQFDKIESKMSGFQTDKPKRTGHGT